MVFQKTLNMENPSCLGSPYCSRIENSPRKKLVCGWYHILEQLCTVLEYTNMKAVKEYNCAIVADQVKEKFGTLRFYFSIMNVDDDGMTINNVDENGDLVSDKLTHRLDENTHRIVVDYLEMLADKFIAEAEDLTSNTCAHCGVPLKKGNKVETKGWISYICKDCDKATKAGKDIKDED